MVLLRTVHLSKMYTERVQSLLNYIFLDDFSFLLVYSPGAGKNLTDDTEEGQFGQMTICKITYGGESL